MLKSFVAGTLLLIAGPVSAQVECRANFDSLAVRIEQNYAGYQLEITGARLTRYQQLKAELSREASRTASADCFRVLTRLTGWFEDPHLFVFQAERLDSTETRRRMATVGHLPLTEALVRADLQRRVATLDPIEGIWYDRSLRLAVVPEPGKGRGRFVAVVLTSDTATWEPGDIRARLTRRKAGRYDVQFWTRDHALRELNATLHRRVLLRLSPGIWGKEFPVSPMDSGSIDPVDAHRATWRSRGETAILAIPSHDPSYMSALEAIGQAHGAALASLQYLIIDLRGNEGGSSWVTNPLLPYVMSAEKRPSPYDTGTAVMLSTKSQVGYAKRAFGSDTSAFVRSLVQRMEAAPGQLVPLNDPANPSPETPDSVAPGPVRVAVLVDGGTVSASEVLVLKALQSTRAVVIGEPTAGALDYQSVYLLRLSPGEDRWYVGYPTITRHAGLPAGGMRGRGIAPDVVVRWNEVEDNYGEALRILRR